MAPRVSCETVLAQLITHLNMGMQNTSLITPDKELNKPIERFSLSSYTCTGVTSF